MLALMSRPKTKDRQLSQYLDVMANHLEQRTIAKIYHQLNNLVPMDAHIMADDMRAMHDLDIKTKTLFTEHIYYNFLAKGMAV